MKPSSRACRYCKSPARGNPCWFALDYPLSGGDPPCIDDDYSEEYAERRNERRRLRRLRRLRWSIFFVVVILASAGAYLLFR